jgi:hypothetical protein
MGENHSCPFRPSVSGQLHICWPVATSRPTMAAAPSCFEMLTATTWQGNEEPVMTVGCLTLACGLAG